MIDTQDKIPTSKVERAMKLVGAGAKIGGNYLKYYAKKTINSDTTKEELHANNANDIYQSLSQLKGSALKVAQMLSMDKNLLPRAYTDKFAMSQYSAPPMSGPLVVRTFKSHWENHRSMCLTNSIRNVVPRLVSGRYIKPKKRAKPMP